MTKLIVKHATDEGEFEQILEREYPDNTPLPEQGQMLEIPAGDEDDEEFDEYFVENLGQRLFEDKPQYVVIVRDAEQVRRQIRERRRKEMQRIQKMQQQGLRQGGGQGGQKGQGGGNPFSIK